jgi:hypothetical protein
MNNGGSPRSSVNMAAKGGQGGGAPNNSRARPWPIWSWSQRWSRWRRRTWHQLPSRRDLPGVWQRRTSCVSLLQEV